MSVQTQISRITAAVGAAYDAVEAKGGTDSTAQTIEGLAGAISGIKSAPTGPYMDVLEYVDSYDEAGNISKYPAKIKLYNHTHIYGAEFAYQLYLQEIDMSDVSNVITRIDGDAFSYAQIESFIIPETVTSLGEASFTNAALGSISIPGGIEGIPNGAFSYTRGYYGGAPQITLNEGLKTIAIGAFSGSTVAQIEIPSTVISIGDAGFGYSSLKTVICKPTTPPSLGAEAFPKSNDGFTIKVPSASVAAYKAATNWSDYADQIVGV